MSKMLALKQPYVEDYNSMISEVVPMTRRGPQSRRSGLATCEVVSTDSGYASTNVPSEPSTTLSPIASRSGTPENDSSTRTLQQQQEQQLERLQQLQKQQQEQHQQQLQQHQQQQQQYQQQDSQRDQREYANYRDRDHQRYQQGDQSQDYQHQYQREERSRTRDREPQSATPMTRQASSHFSSQASSQLSSSSSNPTPSGSRHNSVKSKSRPASPVGHKHGDASTADPDCDCSECRTVTRGTAPSALHTPWNLNYAPFNTAQPTPPYAAGYAVSPMRDHRRPTRDRQFPSRPLSYGGAHPVANASAWGAYNGYYMQNGAPVPVAGAPAYAAQGYPPPINTAVPAQSAATASHPYSATAGYSAHPYSPGHDYWGTQATAAAGAAPADYSSAMPPPPVSARRASNRLSAGLLGNSPRASSEGYHGNYSRRYNEEYGERYPRGHGEEFTRRHAEDYEKYGDYPTSSPISRRMSQRTTQSSGAYSYLREEVPRSTSVPPAGTEPATPADAGRRRTVTPQPTPPSRSRRDSTSTSNSAGVTTGALARVPRPGEISEYDEYTRTPPTTSAVPATTPGSSTSRYAPHTPYSGYSYDDYGYNTSHHGRHHSSSSRYPPTTPLYRGSDSSGTSSGAPDPEGVITSDGEGDGYKTSPPSRYKGSGGEGEVAVHYRQPHHGYSRDGYGERAAVTSHHHSGYPRERERERERDRDREDRRSGAGELTRKKSRRDLEYHYSGGSGSRRRSEWR